jgi:proline iminopeptidase
MPSITQGRSACFQNSEGENMYEVVTSYTHALFPPVEPYRTGRLRVSELHELFYEEAGNPEGLPVLFLHGGPGAGIIPAYRQFFDPAAYHIVLPDQRGAGQSTPHAELRENTTWHIVADLEKLRTHLGIKRWLVFGGSWGSTLGLCYAIRHPDAISGLIIRGVCLGRKWETQWLFQFGCSALYPDRWAEFQSLIPESERDDMVKAYYKRMTEGDENERLRAAAAWTKWEAATMNLVPDPKALEDFLSDKKALSIGRIECYYTINNFFIEPESLILDHARGMQHIPVRIVQHQALPNSDLRIAQLGGHSPLDPAMTDELVRATEEFKTIARW